MQSWGANIARTTVAGGLLVLVALGIATANSHNHSHGHSTAPKSTRVGFYNLCNLFDTINDPSTDDAEYSNPKKYNYTQKIKALASAITLFNPHILGVCEVEKYDCLKDLAKATHRHYNIIHYESNDPRGIDCAILFDTSHFTLHSSEIINIPGISRGITTAQLTNRHTNRQIMVMAAHLPSKLGGPQAKKNRHKILQTIDSIASITPMPVIALGDMNRTPEHLKHLHNTAVEPAQKGMGSYIYRDKWAMPSQIMISHHLVPITKGHQKIVYHPSLLNPGGRFKGYPNRTETSDHLPVFIDLDLSL